MQASWPNFTTKPPQVRVPRTKEYPFMTWVLYDIDAPNPFNRSKTPFLHFARANIACTAKAMRELCDINAVHGDQLVPYTKPDPPNNIVHAYHIEVFGHKKPIDSEKERQLIEASGRARFQLREFKNRNQLKQLYSGVYLADGQSDPTAKA